MIGLSLLLILIVIFPNRCWKVVKQLGNYSPSLFLESRHSSAASSVLSAAEVQD